MNLTEYLHKEAGLSIETATLVDSLCETSEFIKGQILLKEGSYSKKLFYIEKGLIRAYYYNDGKEITYDFFSEMGFFASIESIFFSQSCKYHFEALEYSCIKIVEFPKVEELMEKDLKLQRFVIFLLMRIIRKFSERLQSMQFHTAHERYELLVKKHPDILQRSSLGHIASYLGVTQSTLSVIRSGKSK